METNNQEKEDTLKAIKRRVLHSHKFDYFLKEDDSNHSTVLVIRTFFDKFRQDIAYASNTKEIHSIYSELASNVSPIQEKLEELDNDFNSNYTASLYTATSLLLEPELDDSVLNLGYDPQSESFSNFNSFSEFETKYINSEKFSPEIILRETSPIHQHPQFPRIQEKISNILDKFELASIRKTANCLYTAHEFEYALAYLDSAASDVFQRLGVNKKHFGIGRKISINFMEDLSIFAAFNPDDWSIELSTELNMHRSKKAIFNQLTQSSILHEWIHAIDFKIINELIYTKRISKKEEKPQIFTYENFSSEQEKPFNIPQKALDQYQPYLQLRDLIESFLCESTEPTYLNRTQRNQEFIQSFYQKVISDNWLNQMDSNQQELLLSEKAFLAFRNTILTYNKKSKSNEFVSFLKENEIPLSNEDEKSLHQLFSNKQSQLILKKAIKENESLLNKNGSQYLKISKNADVLNNSIIVSNIVFSHKHEAQPLTVPEGFDHRYNKNIEGHIEPQHFVEDDTFNYYQNPSEMLARYFERNLYPFNSLKSEFLKVATFNGAFKMPLISDSLFQQKKDSLMVAVFGIDALVPIKNKEIPQAAKEFLQMLKNVNEQFINNINPTQAIRENTIQYRKKLEKKSFWNN